MLNIIGRSRALFQEDIRHHAQTLEKISTSSFLVIGGAGSIGSSVVKEIFKRNPKRLHVVDISENNLAELVRDIRSSFAYINGDFRTFSIDFGDESFRRLVANEGPYDYVLNLAALKHVRSERDPYTIARMIQVNIINTINSLQIAQNTQVKKYFAVSSDKAANPANLMGASKRIMELFLFQNSGIETSMARFANVAFSEGSLLAGFHQRLQKGQPLVAPTDISRFFITPEESGILCLMSCLCGSNNEIYFPKDFSELKLTNFSDIALRFLTSRGIKPIICKSEDEARHIACHSSNKKTWPVYLFESDTTGEKPYEEFFTDQEVIDTTSYTDIGVVKHTSTIDASILDNFLNEYKILQRKDRANKEDYVKIIEDILPDFSHIEINKNLDQKM